LQKILVVICLLLLLMSAGCTPASNTVTEPPFNNDTQEPVNTEKPNPEDIIPDIPNGEPQDEIDLSVVRPNELGKVMVLMYHEIGDKEDTWARQKDNFRRDMETLYAKDYRPVNLNDFLNGIINVPAGTTPFILTFDDGTAGQFRLLEEGGNLVVDPDSAVGILMEMNRKYPDFSLAGTFYIYYPLPFRQKEHIAKKLDMLTALGFEIGNHTYGHENLSKVSREEGIRALARHVKTTSDYSPGYTVSTLALPYGARPREDGHLLSGEWEGTSYVNNAILLVGANPSYSPFDTRFNPAKLPRIRADEAELSRWLAYFDSNPDQRYISDGDVSTVTLPEKLEGSLNLQNFENLKVKTYNLSLISD
jgi:peptidoglycan/xylan/chitin deacetylase (PgdA/CDA1 family)